MSVQLGSEYDTAEIIMDPTGGKLALTRGVKIVCFGLISVVVVASISIVVVVSRNSMIAKSNGGCGVACTHPKVEQPLTVSDGTRPPTSSTAFPPATTTLPKAPVACPGVYSMHTHGSETACLKYKATVLNHTDTETYCNGDGGHLVRILSNDKRILLEIALPTRIDRIIIDGMDVGGDDAFYTTDGRNFTGVDWSFYNTLSPGQDCLWALRKDGYIIRDIECSHGARVVCEIDL